MGPSSEESAPVAVPEFLSTLGRSASTPPEILRVNHPPDSLQQLQDQDQIHSSTSSSSNHSYTRFFHRTRTPNHTRSLGSGGTGGLSLLSPIYEPPNSDSRGTQKGGEGSGSSMSQKKTQAPSIHSTTSTIQERIMYLQGTQMNGLIRFGFGLNFTSCTFTQRPPILLPSSSTTFSYRLYSNMKQQVIRDSSNGQ